jgi:uroporphyrinogen decarboxylase
MEKTAGSLIAAAYHCGLSLRRIVNLNRKDLLDTVHYDFPRQTPVIFHINNSCWDHYPQDQLAELMLKHPALFPSGPPDFIAAGKPVPYAPWCREDEPWTDPWGCVWKTSMSGIIGAVTSHPLPSWENFAAYTPPDFRKTTHWYPVEWVPGKIPGGGSIGFFDCLRSGEIGHGHTLLKLFDILGYEHAILEMADETPEVKKLLGMLEAFNAGLVTQFIDTAKVEWLGYAEDLGMQSGPLVSPSMFRTYILPIYRRLMQPAADSNVIIHLHTDGDISALLKDLLTLPIDVINLQDTVHGLDWIAEQVKGRMVIDLDIDRVLINRSANPDSVREYLDTLMRKLHDPAGGLILTYGLYPGVPMPIVEVLMDSLERIARNGSRR